ncbi:MAG: multiheme c-type cytochrome, partial [Mycobacterium leprae]
MLKRTLSLLALLLGMIPTLAFAGTVSTRVMTTGGSISVNGGAAQTSANGTVSKFYSTAVPVAITPASGYSIAKVTLNGVLQPLATPLPVPLSVSPQSVTVSFARQLVSVTATATTADGTVSPYGTSNLYANAAAIYTFSPNVGKSVESISGLPDGTVLKDASGNAVTKLPFAGTVKAYFNVPVTPVNIVASFVGLSASAGAPQTVLTSSSATLKGSASLTEGTTFVWTQTGGPSLGTNWSVTGATVSVVFPEAGTYNLKLTASNGELTAVSSTSVTAAASMADAAQTQCENCHADAGVGAGNYTAWSASVHGDSAHSLCYSCHVGANTGSHPGVANACADCHKGGYLPAQSAHTASADCKGCHTTGSDSHTAHLAKPGHLDGAVAPGPAQYVSSTVTCSNCHNAEHTAIMAEFAGSAHGNPTGDAWAHYDWRGTGRDACQRCHNGTAFAGRLEVLGTTPGNFFGTTGGGQPGEVLNCSACHADVSTGELRAASHQFSIPCSNSASIAYDVPGASALCVRCHGGRESGDSIKGSTGNFADLSFINSHYLAAGATIYNKGGYHFAGQTYTTSGYHKEIGAADAYGTGSAGPCVACHMSAGNGHSWNFVTKDAEGRITANNSTICVNCHGALTGAALESTKQEYEAALAALKAALAAKGILFNNAHPYFYKDLNGNGLFDEATEAGSSNAFKNWDGVDLNGAADGGTGQGKDVMGAAFNYNLLVHEPGAWAHNKQYALKLIADSCDLLADGVVDGAGVPAAVTTAQNSTQFAEATSHPAAIVAASASTDCTACHVPAPHYGGTAFLKAQYVSAASLAISCADCHSDPVNTTANQAILVQFGQSAHGDPAGEAWRHYDWRTSNRSSCARCHTGTGFVAKLGSENDTTSAFQSGDILKPGEALACSACHANAGTGELRAADQQFTINMKNGAAASYDVAGASTHCARCHSGRETGESIKADTDITGVRGFVDSHYQPVTGIVYNKGGYEYADQSYALGSHKLLGATGQGPCVTCHMPGKDHTFVAAACGACHGVTALAVDASALKANYDTALNNLKLALEAKG